ncbi:PAS domain-containing protein [bacterium]|nr:PAS domain-containing protein [bacterium]
MHTHGPSGSSGKTDRKAIPVPALILLFIAFTGSLGLKAWEERVSADKARLNDEMLAAQSAADMVGADLVALRSRIEGMFQAGASRDAVRAALSLKSVHLKEIGDRSWAQIAPDGASTVFARDQQGRWVAAERSTPIALPDTGPSRTVRIAEIAGPDRAFRVEGGQRLATACAPVSGAGAAVCTQTPAPLVGLGDLNRLLIYVLLVAAPALAVFGLIQALRAGERPPIPKRALGSATPLGRQLHEHEVPNVLGFWSWNRIEGVMSFGHEAAALLGAPAPGDMMLDDMMSFVAEADRPRVLAELSHSNPIERFSIPFRGVGSNAQHYLEIVGGPTEDGFAGVIINISERVTAKNRSRRAEALARTAIDAYPGPFAIWDTRRRLTHWNRAFQTIFGLDPAIVQVGASYDHIMAEAARSIRTERPLGEDSHAREIHLTSDRWLRLIDRKTSSDGYITAGLDITTLKAQESDLLRKERRLTATVIDLERVSGQAQELARQHAGEKAKAERANAAKNVFLANMSHELRTPLNHINGFSEMIMREVHGTLGDRRYKGYAEDIHAAGEHLLDMINDILDMAKIEAGKMQIVSRPIDPFDAVDAAVRMIRRRAEVKGLTLTAVADEDLPEINGDHRAIKQMTLNLVANAIKFTEAGGAIRVETAVDGDWIVIRVKDNGIGISKQDLPRLAQPFEQAGQSDDRSVQGTGLGLALTKSFAEMHGGYLRIESELGVGTTVSIYLPITSASPAAPSPAPRGQRTPILS